MIIVRSDSSYQIGTGHILRCLQLAKELRRQGLTVHFVCADLDGHVGHLIRAENFALTLLPPETNLETEVSLIKDLSPSWIIVDHYQLDREWESQFQNTAPVFVIDDLADRSHAGQVLLDQNYHSKVGQYEGLVPTNCRVYEGPQFSLLKTELLNHAPVAKVPQSVLCFFGGTDYTGETLKLALHLATAPKAAVHFSIVVGEKNVNLAEIKALQTDRFDLHVQPANWHELLASSTLFLGGGGTVTWERMFLGVPGAVISVAENQRQIAEDLGRDRYQIYLGSFENQNYTDVIRQVGELLQQPEKLTQIAHKAQSLVRPFPAELIRSLFVQPSETEFILKQADQADANFLLDLRNDPLTRAMFKNSDPVLRETHLIWLNQKLAEKTARLYIAYFNGKRCGQFRVDADLATSVSVQLDFRGQGLAERIILAGSRLYRAEFPLASMLTAEIRDDNTASKKAFEAAGYKIAVTAVENTGYVVYRLSLGDLI